MYIIIRYLQYPKCIIVIEFELISLHNFLYFKRFD